MYIFYLFAYLSSITAVTPVKYQRNLYQLYHIAISYVSVTDKSMNGKKTLKLRVIGLCEGNSPGPVNSPHKGPVTRKMIPFDDVIMNTVLSSI